MAAISFKHLTKTYENGVTAVNDFSLDIDDGEFFVLAGESGAGKSTILKLLAGLSDITGGEIYIDGKLVNNLKPQKRGISMVFQTAALMEYTTVYNNIAFPFKILKTPKAEIDKKVRETAEILNISELLNRKAGELSGGQKQRTALGRAIIIRPQVFLLDEPLSGLDPYLRRELKNQIKEIHKTLKTTFIYVTHNQAEAMSLGTRIGVLKDGFLRQADTPKNLYNSPADTFCAGFFSPVNFLDWQLNGVDAIAGIRPEHIYVNGPDMHNDSLKYGAHIDFIEETGAVTILNCTLIKSGEKIIINTNPEHKIQSGDNINVSFDSKKMMFFDKQNQKRLT